MKHPVSFAVIGYGHIGKRHAGLIQTGSQSVLAAICDSSNDPMAKIEGCPVFNSLPGLLQSGIQFDVAVIATPNGLHARHALEMLQAGKHVLIEKPMALTVGDCEAIMQEAALRQRQVLCVMQNRYAQPVAWLKEIIIAEKLGKLYFVQVNCFWNRNEDYYARPGWHGSRQMDGGSLFTQFSHFIDLLLWLFGDITDITAQMANYRHGGLIEFEDTGSVQFSLANGAMGNLNYSTAVYNNNLESSITLIGEKGSLKLGGQYMDKLLICDIEGLPAPVFAPADPLKNHAFVLNEMAGLVNGDAAAVSNAPDGCRVVETIERIYKAAQYAAPGTSGSD